jgi:hypothetical protein
LAATTWTSRCSSVLVLHLLRLLPFLVGGHRQLALENQALRQQLIVYKRTMSRPPDANELLQAAFRRHTWASVQSLGRDPHDATERCWLHVRGVCLSTVPVPGDGVTPIDGRAAAATGRLQEP